MAGIGLDAAVVAANAGLLPGGFTLLAGEVLARGRRQDGALGFLQTRRVQVSADTVLPRQVDGEIVAPGRALTVSVCPGTLVVRLPGPARRTSNA